MSADLLWPRKQVVHLFYKGLRDHADRSLIRRSSILISRSGGRSGQFWPATRPLPAMSTW